MSGTQAPLASVPADATMASRVAAWGPLIVSFLVLGVFVVAIVVAWLTKDASLGILLGMAATNAGTAVGFWLGSSAGSQKKDSTIAASMAALPSPPPGTPPNPI